MLAVTRRAENARQSPILRRNCLNEKNKSNGNEETFHLIGCSNQDAGSDVAAPRFISASMLIRPGPWKKMKRNTQQ